MIHRKAPWNPASNAGFLYANKADSSCCPPLAWKFQLWVAPDGVLKTEVFSCCLYRLISRILYCTVLPLGTVTVTSSPILWPISALPTGDSSVMVSISV